MTFPDMAVVPDLLFELARICVLCELPECPRSNRTLNDSVVMDNCPRVSNEPAAIVNIHLEWRGRGRGDCNLENLTIHTASRMAIQLELKGISTNVQPITAVRDIWCHISVHLKLSVYLT
jgi:hypothetical protein